MNDIPGTESTAPDPGPSPVPVPPRFLTLRQVAEELNTKDTTIRGLITSGELPAIQIGGRGQASALMRYAGAAGGDTATAAEDPDRALGGHDRRDQK